MERQSHLWIYKSDNLPQMSPETRNTLMIKQEGKSFLITMCQKNCISVKWIWPRRWNTHVRSVCTAPGACTVSRAGGENRSPLTVKLKCTELSRFWQIMSPSWWPHWWHSLEEATQGASSPVLTDTKRRTSVWISGLNAGLLLYSIQTLILCQRHPWVVRRVGRRLGVFFLCILKPLSRGRWVRSQVPTEPRRMPKARTKSCGHPSERTHLCWTIRQFSPWWWICWRLMSWIWNDSSALFQFLMLLPSFVRNESWWPERDQRVHWFSPNQDRA